MLRKLKQKEIDAIPDIDSLDADSFHLINDLNTPSAIVELTGTSLPNLVWNKDTLEVNTLISILSLFRVGGVEFIEYDTQIDSMFPSKGISTKKIRLLRSGNYLVSNEDVESLKLFWLNTKSVSLPASAYPGLLEKPDELSIAYDRYNDSLEIGIIEKRISSAVMGLEALFLKEVDELPYRLSMRVGKLLSLAKDNYKPVEVRDNLKAAYKIRNKYVHGVTLKTEQRIELEVNQFAQIVKDYLRASIVALLKRPSKTSLIDKIDDSFLDSSKDEEIKKLLFMPYG
jgi:hypothetical protein